MHYDKMSILRQVIKVWLLNGKHVFWLWQNDTDPLGVTNGMKKESSSRATPMKPQGKSQVHVPADNKYCKYFLWNNNHRILKVTAYLKVTPPQKYNVMLSFHPSNVLKSEIQK